MCGITGVFNFLSHEPVDPGVVRRCADSMIHRGPDDSGLYVTGELGLGFRRLSIIDIDGGHQPMSDESGTVWTVFNGEIFNFKDLRQELENAGFRFRTESDTETIVHGYRKWGLGLFERLNGMFGVAIWDEPLKRLVLARDRVGIKPLYYAMTSHGVVFGSEIRAILASAQTRYDIDLKSLHLYLRYGFVPSPHTMFDGICRLPAGNLMLVEGDRATVQRWWNFEPRPCSDPISDGQVVRDVINLYTEAVRRHLISDVPVGLLLSGGIDSNLLLALMNNFGESWPTYTVGFGTEFRDDELQDAARSARMLGSDHTSVRLSRSDFETLLPKAISILEEPLNSASVVPMFAVCQRARQDVTVAIMGQGPDELFGGYRRHLGVQYGHLWRTAPPVMRRAVGAALSKATRSETIRRGLSSLDCPEKMERYEQIFSLLPSGAVDRMIRQQYRVPGSTSAFRTIWGDVEALIGSTDELGGFSFLELSYFMPDELLLYGDKISMANSLEIRFPFLDATVIEYVQCLPASLKIRHFQRKWAHRMACRTSIPADVIRRKKKNFAHNVVDDWFRSSMEGKFEDFFFSDHSMMYAYLEPSAVRSLVHEHSRGRADYHKSLYTLIVLEEWLRANEAVLSLETLQ